MPCPLLFRRQELFKMANRVANEEKEVGCSIQAKMEEEEVMDTTIWNNFPAELMGLVLARLPFQSLIRFRCVCKEWGRLLSSQSFLDEIQQASRPDLQETCWFLSGTLVQNRVAVYAPSQNRWHIRTISSLGELPHDATVVAEATMGGLVCLTKYSIGNDWEIPTAESFVWNPLTNCARCVPAQTSNYVSPSRFVVGMYVDIKAKQYKLIAVGNSHGTLYTSQPKVGNVVLTEIYDSFTNSWKVCKSLFPHPTVSKMTRCNVCCNGLLYCIMSEPYSIVAFDVRAEVWREMEIPIADLESPNLIELRYNTLYIVGGISTDRSIRIWQILEHRDGVVEWIEVDRISPELLVQKGCSIDVKQYWQPDTSRLPAGTRRLWRCVGSGDCLFVKYWGSQQVLMYSISRRSWSGLPVCDLASKQLYYHDWNGLAFCPGWMSP